MLPRDVLRHNRLRFYVPCSAPQVRSLRRSSSSPAAVLTSPYTTARGTRKGWDIHCLKAHPSYTHAFPVCIQGADALAGGNLWTLGTLVNRLLMTAHEASDKHGQHWAFTKLNQMHTAAGP